MDIFITVDKQKMRCDNYVRNFVAGTQEFILFNFLLTEEWDDLVVYAQFNQGANSYNVYLDSDNRAYLPPEIGEGICSLVLRGTKGNTVAVTEPLELKIAQNPIKGGLSSTGVTLTLYEQLVNKVDGLLQDDSLIVNTTKKVLQEYLDDGKFAAMALGDYSIDVKKLSHDAIATNEEIKEFLSVS